MSTFSSWYTENSAVLLIPLKKCNGCGLFGGKNVAVVEYSLEKMQECWDFRWEKCIFVLERRG